MRAVFVILSLISTAFPSFSWNAKGHMVVAYIAFKSLKPEVKAKTLELLKKNPEYKNWVKGIPAGAANDDKRLMIAMMNAANWPDFIKGKSGYTSDGEPGSNGNTPVAGDAKAKQNIGYKDKLRHKYWHFHDTAFTMDGTATREPATPSAATQIPILLEGLKSGTTTDIRSYDLVWLIHLVGDVHQPLHSAGRFTNSQPKGDDGGNGLKLSSGGSNLHSLWDGLLGNEVDPSDAVELGDQLLGEAATLPSPGSQLPEDWLKDSLELAKTASYADPPIHKDGRTSPTTKAYRAKARDVAEDQVLLAGVRLARVINDSVH